MRKYNVYYIWRNGLDQHTYCQTIYANTAIEAKHKLKYKGDFNELCVITSVKEAQDDE